MGTFNSAIRGSHGNWNSSADGDSLIKPKKLLAMGRMPSPSASPNGRQGMVRDTGRIGRSGKKIDMTPSGSKP